MAPGLTHIGTDIGLFVAEGATHAAGQLRFELGEILIPIRSLWRDWRIGGWVALVRHQPELCGSNRVENCGGQGGGTSICNSRMLQERPIAEQRRILAE